ncbi:DUF2933 domain-containing protein [Clostridium formicaceticum]|jgi:hypothetical protein|uniref:DUF2933 domain-containing protein n=1 Tax=Clostridium formicaceticum TaxID=1497 RepID=A0AAC9WHX4_9CLOT|nr:DUF2933 domain-containing protein [Clostridium formicaceticum]AOY74811.1 DUF2933 domain-containing protein [Clostridium formicaceticum]ARE89204.1 hypothetical protein CLFO_36110 [Clostridium formicaceticum]
MNHKGKNHGMMMLLCCLVPLAAILFLPRLGIQLGPVGRLAPYAMLLICPLMHIGMMVFMFKGRKQGCCEDEQAEKQIQ